MTPLQAYYQKIQEKTLQPDTWQEMAMQHLQHLYESLVEKKTGMTLRKKKTVKGLYLWGNVGRGKTQLMDLFYQQLPIPKFRTHFYAFMQTMHRELTRLQGVANPLHKIAEDLAQRTKIICLDEFLVHDIADALLLARLLHALFQKHIILVTTANTPPDALYQNGLQRELFLPAIEEIKHYLTIFHVDSPVDYRLRAAPLAFSQHAYSSSSRNPVLTLMPQQVHTLFASLSKEKTVSYQPLSIHDRLISHNGHTEDTVWFDFTSICAIPRSQIDYLALATLFSTVLISRITVIREQDDNRARLFMQLVDIFYDAKRTLILTSEQPIDDIYPKGRFLSEFKRTKSRLVELHNASLVLTLIDK